MIAIRNHVKIVSPTEFRPRVREFYRGLRGFGLDFLFTDSSGEVLSSKNCANAAWMEINGRPRRLVDEASVILVGPTGRERFVVDLAEATVTLAQSREAGS